MFAGILEIIPIPKDSLGEIEKASLSVPVRVKVKDIEVPSVSTPEYPIVKNLNSLY